MKQRQDEEEEITECSLGGSSRQTGCQSKRWRCRRVTHNTSSPKTPSTNLLPSTSITSCFRVASCQRAGWPRSRQVSLVGWWPLSAIDLWWSGLPRLPAGRATLPAAARASFGLSSVSTWPEQPQPGAVSGKHNRDSRPLPERR